MHFEAWQIALGAVSAFIVGFSKTGVPGTGIVMVPMMAAAFGGRLSVGATLPMLIVADIVAISMYHEDTQWHHLKKLAPWVVAGILLGTVTLDWLATHRTHKDILGIVIGVMVFGMLALSLLRGRLGDRLIPTSKSGVRATGVMAGFSTMVSNAAGPIMQIYLVATGMSKNQMMHTTAWYFFIFNLFKVPFLAAVTARHPEVPLITKESLLFDLAVVPAILVGAFAGKRLLPIIPQKTFTNLVLTLSAVGAAWLIISSLHG